MSEPKEFEINTVWHDNGHADHDIQQIFDGKKPLTSPPYTHVIEISAYDAINTKLEKFKNIVLNQDRNKGYPTGSEWTEIVAEFKNKSGADK